MNNYTDIINSPLINIFNDISVIDVLNDKVTMYSVDSVLKVLKEMSFVEYIDSLNSKYSKEESDKILNYISIQRLEQELNAGNNNIKVLTKDNEGNSFNNIIKIVNDNNNKLIIVMTISSGAAAVKNVQEDSSKVQLIVNAISEAILKIYNTIDIDTGSYTNNYIKDVLEQLTNSIPEIRESFQNDLISQVNESKKTVLIVDDDFMTRSLLKKTFQEEYDIIEAENGKIAIDIIQDNLNVNSTDIKKNIACIFLDITMPVLDGFGVLDYLKNANLLTKIPTIVVSAAEEKETRTKTYQYNIADMLEKPFNLDIIKHRTVNFINLYRTSNNLKELVMLKNKKLSDMIISLVNNKDPKVYNYINIMIRELQSINYYNNNMLLEAIDLALEYSSLLSNNVSPYEVIIKEENTRYNSIIINIFKKVYTEFN